MSMQQARFEFISKQLEKGARRVQFFSSIINRNVIPLNPYIICEKRFVNYVVRFSEEGEPKIVLDDQLDAPTMLTSKQVGKCLKKAKSWNPESNLTVMTLKLYCTARIETIQRSMDLLLEELENMRKQA